MPRAKRGSGDRLPTFSPSVTVMRYRSGERPNPFSAIGPMNGERNKDKLCPSLDGPGLFLRAREASRSRTIPGSN